MSKPDAKQIKAMADVAGIPVSAEVAERIANSIGPAVEGFAAVAGTLPLDLGERHQGRLGAHFDTFFACASG